MSPERKDPSEAARECLEEALTVYEVRDPYINRRRRAEKERVIEWTVSEIRKGWLPEGSRRQLPEMTWRSGYWEGVRGAVMAYHGRRCAFCGKEAAEVHHIRPRAYGGTDQPRNLMPLCRECHEEVHRRLEKGLETAIELAVASMTASMRSIRALEDWR